MRADADSFVMRTPGDSGTASDFAAVRAIGVEPLVQYLVNGADGGLQVLENAYDPVQEVWFNVFGDDRQPGEWGHWSGRGMNWNSRCASCHNTNLQKNYDVRSDRFATTFEEPGVGCEACHGPLGVHVVDPANEVPGPRSQDRVLHVCGSCHARRTELTGAFSPGEAFDDHFLLSVVDGSDRYYADGQVRDENYVFGSFLGSRMHRAGVVCGDCHDPHTDELLLAGNALCQRCHGTGLLDAPLIEPSGHTHHAEGNPGSQCVACHMPQTTYMQRHPRRDHGFTSPDPSLTVELGVPNACNRCHEDRIPQWALDRVTSWYQPVRALRSRERGHWVASARALDPAVVAPLKAMLEQEPSEFWRASAASLLGNFLNEAQARRALLAGLGDDRSLVRAYAVRSLEPLAQNGDPAVVQALRPLLADPARNVRIATAMVLRGIRGPGVRARPDVKAFLDHNADQPQGRLQFSLYDLSRGDHRAALAHIEQALVWDRASTPLLQQQAVVLSELGRSEEAVNALEEAVRLAPDSAHLHYLLGLAYNEVNEAKRMIAELRRAVALSPALGRAWYNLGLALHAEGEADSALDALERAQVTMSDDPRPSYARATIHYQRGDLDASLAAAEEALRVYPDYVEARSLAEMVRQARQREPGND